MSKLQVTETQRAVSQLSISAFYFACRSCEYVKVQQAELRRTDILRLRSIQFRRHNRVIRHDNPELEYADCVTLTFEMQKKEEKFDTVTQYCTKHEVMCPVRAWAAIVKRIQGKTVVSNTSHHKTSSMVSIAEPRPSDGISLDSKKETSGPIPFAQVEQWQCISMRSPFTRS
eukprot:scaffold12750_cov51-Cyclotella_meneghiniana.AAC.2